MIRAGFTLVSTLLLLVGCAGATPVPSISPITIPTFPPIVLPSGLLPSADANSGVCLLVTPAEIGAIMGSPATVTDNTSKSCSYTFSNFSSVVVTIDTGDLSTAKLLFGGTAKDLTVGNLPAVSGSFFGQPGVYVQRGGAQLQIQGILTGSDDAAIAKMVQIAQLAVTRWP
jgi:hypothetical protein